MHRGSRERDWLVSGREDRGGRRLILRVPPPQACAALGSSTKRRTCLVGERGTLRNLAERPETCPGFCGVEEG